MKPHPRVLILGAANSIHLQRWVLALHERGRQVQVVSQHAGRALPLPAAVELHHLPWSGGAGYLLNAPALRRLLAALRPALLHVHYASGYGTLAAFAGYRPTLLSVWGSDVYDFPERSRLAAALLRHNLRAAQALASTSEAMADRVRQLLGAAVPIAVTPFGVDLERFSPAPDAGGDKPSRPLVIGTVKTLEPVYGIDLLLRAYALLRARRPGRCAPLQLVGGGAQRADFERLAAELGIAEWVEFVGEVDHAQVPDRLRRLDIYVAPSRQESFGVAVVEAMACGLPVVVSDAGGLPEVVRAGESGLVVPRGDVQALAAALERLVDDAGLRSRLAAAAVERARSAYAWPLCVDRMIECQDAVIAQHQVSA